MSIRTAARTARTRRSGWPHTGGHGPKPLPIVWGHADPLVRGPVIGTVTNRTHRNVIGTHAGAYSVYRALAVAAGVLDPSKKPDLRDTAPTHAIGPFLAEAGFVKTAMGYQRRA